MIRQVRKKNINGMKAGKQLSAFFARINNSNNKRPHEKEDK